MINLPIYRAKKIDSDEWVEGYLVQIDEITSYIVENYFDLWDGWKPSEICTFIQIDPSTLAISFDKGKTWRSIEQVQEALEYKDKLHLAMPADYEEENTRSKR